MKQDLTDSGIPKGDIDGRCRLYSDCSLRIHLDSLSRTERNFSQNPNLYIQKICEGLYFHCPQDKFSKLNFSKNIT